ncbi:MAG: amidohydrolase family protein [Melioribacteraceae bacterium]|jgi:predicted TIM-barrel fold metal-dependent hydrolase|nr:amidohydrolase family protein [Melioribacteraceae bacterium]
MYNCHIHTFTDKTVPDGFLPLGLIPIMRTQIGYNIMTSFLKNIIPFTHKDYIEKYAEFIRIGKLPSQDAIFDLCSSVYPHGTQFIVITMDMSQMGAGKVRQPYREQITEIGELSKRHQNIIPFIHLDPRNTNHYDNLLLAHEVYGFEGVKIYPNLGHLPDTAEMINIFEYCKRFNLSMIFHCSPFNPVHFQGTKEEFKKALSGSIFYNKIDFNQSKRTLSSYFSHPLNYKGLFKVYDTVNCSFAHFGSEYYWDKYLKKDFDDNWFLIIKGMLQTYKRVFSDISFTANNKNYFPIIKELIDDPLISEKIIYGSDFSMNSTRKSEYDFYNDLKNSIGEERFKKISFDNAIKFLYRK